MLWIWAIGYFLHRTNGLLQDVAVVGWFRLEFALCSFQLEETKTKRCRNEENDKHAKQSDQRVNVIVAFEKVRSCVHWQRRRSRCSTRCFFFRFNVHLAICDLGIWRDLSWFDVQERISDSKRFERIGHYAQIVAYVRLGRVQYVQIDRFQVGQSVFVRVVHVFASFQLDSWVFGCKITKGIL